MYEIENLKLENLEEGQISEIRKKLDEYGVVVLKSVFSDEECDQYVTQSVDWLVKTIPPLTRQVKTWTPENLPMGPRKGMYQSLIGHSPVAWELRTRLYPLFKGLHLTEDLISSIDGATIYPPVEKSKKDWPHIDQTKSESEIVCFQGQVVLTNTTASFRCTPKSHLQHSDLVKEFEMDVKNQWYKFSDEEIEKIKNRFEDWQIPIVAPKGSIILWRSTTIHSAKYVDDPTLYQPDQSWDGWRCVYYICMRPKSQFSKRGLTTIKNAALTGRTTNHWGNKLFPKKGRWDKKHPDLEKILQNPQVVVKKDLTPLQKKLVNLL